MKTNADDSSDPLLDQVVAHLRDAVPPPTPDALTGGASGHETTPKVDLARHRKRRGAAWTIATTAAAALVIALWTYRGDAERQRVTGPTLEAKPRGEVTQIRLSSLRPFANLERTIDEMETQLAELRQQAALLDVRRKIDALLAIR